MKKKETVKSPLKQQPLHLPGQSLDAELARIVDDKAYPWVAVVAFCFVITLLEWYRYFLDLAPHPKTVTGFTALFIIYGIYRLLKYRKRLKALVLGRDGEREVGHHLESLRAQGCVVYHDIVGDGFNVDHVVIGPQGVFTVETKTRSKTGKNDKVEFKEDKVYINGRETHENPVVQVRAQAGWIRSILEESTGKSFHVKPVILYPGWYVESKTPWQSTSTWVMNPKYFTKMFQSCPIVLADEDVRLASYHLARFIRVS